MVEILLQIAQADTRFLLEQHTARKMASLVQQVLSGNLAPHVAFGNSDPAPVTARYQVGGSGQSEEPVNVRVIRIHGVMTMADQLCAGPGTERIGKMIQRADNDPTYGAIVLDISSPGGEARYTETLASIVRNTKKPIVAFVNQIAASAAYWTASSADEVILSGKTAEVGSIGTVLEYWDPSRNADKEGFDLVSITATKSTSKRKYKYLQPSEEDQDLIRVEILDPINEVFHEAVKSARKITDQNAFTGEMYIGQSAIDVGLADSFGTLESAVIRAAQLSKNQTSSKMSNQNGAPATQEPVWKVNPQGGPATKVPTPDKPTQAAADPEPAKPIQAAQSAEQGSFSAAVVEQMIKDHSAALAQKDAVIAGLQDENTQLKEENKTLGQSPSQESTKVIPAQAAASPFQATGSYDPAKSSVTQEALEKYAPKERE